MRPNAVVHRWDQLDLEKVTEMVSRKIIVGQHQMLAQVYLKRGAQVPTHTHESEQMTYVLQGTLRCRVGDEAITVCEGEVLVIQAGTRHQAEAIEDTFVLDLFGQPAMDQ